MTLAFWSVEALRRLKILGDNTQKNQVMKTTATSASRKSAATFQAGAKTLPQPYFVSQEIFAEESQKIFATNWVLVGHQSQLGKPGDYFIAEVAGESLIVAKDQRSTIRAFYNVCRHRGARLCEGQNGHGAAIQCPYHAWTYALDGRLLGAPHMDETPGFNKTEYPLNPARLGLWEGFIFLNLANASTERGDYNFEQRDGDNFRKINRGAPVRKP